jgi:hypothetical protein
MNRKANQLRQFSGKMRSYLGACTRFSCSVDVVIEALHDAEDIVPWPNQLSNAS